MSFEKNSRSNTMIIAGWGNNNYWSKLRWTPNKPMATMPPPVLYNDLQRLSRDLTMGMKLAVPLKEMTCHYMYLVIFFMIRKSMRPMYRAALHQCKPYQDVIDPDSRLMLCTVYSGFSTYTKGSPSKNWINIVFFAFTLRRFSEVSENTYVIPFPQNETDVLARKSDVLTKIFHSTNVIHTPWRSWSTVTMQIFTIYKQ